MNPDDDLRHLLARGERLTPDADTVHSAIRAGIRRRRQRRRAAAGGVAVLAVAGLVAVVALPRDDRPTSKDSLFAGAEPTLPPTSAPTPEPGLSPSVTVSPRPSHMAVPVTPSVPRPGATGAPHAVPPVPTTVPPRTSPPAAAAGRETLTGGGLSVSSGALPFGTAYSRARPLLDAALGAPSHDTGVIAPFSKYGTCPGTQLRVLEYGGLEIYFGDVAADSSVSGRPPALYAWGLTPVTAGTPAHVEADGVVLRIGMTVAELTASTRRGTLELQPVVGDDPPPPGFVLTTAAGPVWGALEPDTSPSAKVTYLDAGRRCGD